MQQQRLQPVGSSRPQRKLAGLSSSGQHQYQRQFQERRPSFQLANHRPRREPGSRKQPGALLSPRPTLARARRQPDGQFGRQIVAAEDARVTASRAAASRDQSQRLSPRGGLETQTSQMHKPRHIMGSQVSLGVLLLASICVSILTTSSSNAPVECSSLVAPVGRQQAHLSDSGRWRPSLAGGGGNSKLRKIHSEQQPAQFPSQDEQTGGQANETGGLPALALSITPRTGLVRVPVESNVILKCLISLQQPAAASKQAAKRFELIWSRYMYDESVYEQLENFPPMTGDSSPASEPTNGAITQPPAKSEANSSELAQQQQPQVFNRQQQLRDFLARSRQEINQISDILVEASLSISPVRASDNATYYCTASNQFGDEKVARIDLVALSKAQLRLDQLQPAKDSKSALVFWTIISDGNTPIKRTILMIHNDTKVTQAKPNDWRPAVGKQDLAPPVEPSASTGQTSHFVIDSEHQHWQRIDIEGDGEPVAYYRAPNQPQHQLGDIEVTSSQQQAAPSGAERRRFELAGRGKHFDRRQRWFNLTSMLPGFTYNLRLAAINDMGQSAWSELTYTMQNELPAQISEVFLLTRKNDSLAIGWRRPSYDTAKTIRYELQLFDLNRTLTLDANTNTSDGSPRTNFMYVFVGLNAGTDYHFHVRACSRAGCNDYSSPKLLASTLDGEPDEPQEVEVSCPMPATANTTAEQVIRVTWLPPSNVRGQLLNYTVQVEARASYVNITGHLNLDEWRSRHDTQDNHTLSLDIGDLQANTNYTVRVCANNRSKQCGKLSSLGSRTQCQLPAALPQDFPPGARLISKPLLNSPDSDQQQQPASSSSVESLVAEFPGVTMRNGTIDCVQFVLIRLPSSFDSKVLPLNKFGLPLQPSELRLIESLDELRARTKPKFFAETTTTATTTENDSINQIEASPKQFRQENTTESLLAYVADELEASSWQWGRLARGEHQQVLLGDGNSHSCASLRARQSALAGPSGDPSAGSSQLAPVFDAQLWPQTYYTGYIRLIMLSEQQSGLAQSKQIRDQLLSKYSGYFEPVQTGESVPELAQIAEDKLESMSYSEVFANLSSPIDFGEMARRLLIITKNHLNRWQLSARRFVAENVRLEILANLILNSPPWMQLLEVGLIVILLTLLVLSLVYLIALSNSRRRKRRRRRLQNRAQKQRKNRQQLQRQHPVRVAETSLIEMQRVSMAPMVPIVGPQGPEVAPAPVQVVDQATPTKRMTECPVHSSPIVGRYETQVTELGACLADQNRYQANHQHHHHHVQPAPPPQQLPHNGFDHQHLAHQDEQLYSTNYGQFQPPNQYQHQQVYDQYERNCRTSRRIHRGSSAGTAPDSNAGELTLGHQHSLGLAKKISKPIPLRLFSAVFEYRLRNNWLRDEYDQLPRLLLATNDEQQVSCSKKLSLRPQWVISRTGATSKPSRGNDSGADADAAASGSDTREAAGSQALISGNENYDASLISPTNSQGEQSLASNIICAKSPLDADSVWDFWRLVLDQEVSTIVMLTHTEDPNSGELRCAQYWPTNDNEETTILSPCNEFVLKSTLPPAKFKIRQETLSASESELASPGLLDVGQLPLTGSLKMRRLTLLVLASKPSECTDDNQSAHSRETNDLAQAKQDTDQDEPLEPILERQLMHFQFANWNMSTLSNQMRLIKFIEFVNERHLRSQRTSDPELMQPILVHCTNGLGRSGLFAAMSLILDELLVKLHCESQQLALNQNNNQQQQVSKINLFQLISRLRGQREMLLSPYRFYELLYQLTSNCIPSQYELARPGAKANGFAQQQPAAVKAPSRPHQTPEHHHQAHQQQQFGPGPSSRPQ